MLDVESMHQAATVATMTYIKRDGDKLTAQTLDILLHRFCCMLTLKVLVETIDAQWEGMGDVGSARYEPALLPPCTTIRVLSYSN